MNLVFRNSCVIYYIYVNVFWLL